MTENKRYFKRMWEEEYYIFDSETISEEKFDEKVEYEEYRAFEDSMMGDEVVKLLNELHNKYIDEYTLRETLQLELQRVEEENKELKKQVNDLQFNKSIGQREYQRRLSE